jgi:hypothetical protein
VHRQYVQRLRSAEITDAARQLVFSTFYYKGNVISSQNAKGSYGGKCGEWEEFYGLVTRLPLKNAYFSSFSLSSGAHDFESRVTTNNSYSCNNRDIIKAMMVSLNNEEDYSVLCNGIAFRISKCSTGMTICANCKTVCRSDWCQAPVESTAITIQPCQSCDARKAFYQIWDLIYDFDILYPVITFPTAHVVGRTSVSMQLSIAGTGRIYCRAIGRYDAGVDSNWMSPFALKSSGKLLTAYTNGNYSMELMDLLPSSTYDIYCYSEDFNGNGMDLPKVLAMKQTILTKCCAQVSFIDSPRQIPPLSPTTSVNIESLPSWSISVNEVAGLIGVVKTSVQFLISPDFSNACNASATIMSSMSQASAYASPSSIEFNRSAMGLLPKSFVVMGSPGCYMVSARLHIDGISVSQTNQSLIIQSQNITDIPPQLVSATLSKDGTKLLVLFDSNTDEASVMKSDATFPCSTVLSFSHSSAILCSWVTPRMIVAILSNVSVSVDEVVFVNPGMIRSLFCVSYMSPSTCSFANSSIMVRVKQPSDAIVPTVSISTASIAHICDDIEIDITGSFGSANRPWASVLWTVGAKALNGTNLVSLATAIQSHLQSAYGTDTARIAIIPVSLLSSNIANLKVEIKLTNAFGKSNSGYTEIALSSASNTPTVRILGPNAMSLYRSSSLNLKSEVTFPSCYSGSTMGMNLRWVVFDGVQYMPSIVSQSNSPSIFYLPAFSLSPLAYYTIQIIASTNIGKIVATSVVVQVLQNSVVARIGGGDLRTVSADQDLILDGSGSFSLDFPTNSSVLSFAWSCKDVSIQNFGGQCTGFILPSISKYSQSLEGYRNINGSSTLEISLMVTSRIDRSTSSVVQYVEILPRRNVPQVILFPVPSKYNSARSIVFTARVVAVEPTEIGFTVVDTIANRSSKFLSFHSTLPAGNNIIQQSLVPNALRAGGVYRLKLVATYASSRRSSYSQTTIFMNSPPSGGQLHVSPFAGVALSTVFQYLTFGWQAAAENYPIRYTMQYVLATSQLPIIVQSESASSIARSVIASGLPSLNYSIECSAIVVDVYGSLSSASRTIFVRPGTVARNATAMFGNLQLLLSNADPTVNPNAVAQAISATVNTLNVANCSLAPVSSCTAKFRFPCAFTPNTCGSCLDGYFGPAGDSNVACLSTNISFVADGDPCVSNSNCLSNTCRVGRCAAEENKRCPNQCSGRGSCVFKSIRVQNNINGELQSCRGSNPYCQAECLCQANYFGQDCSYDFTDATLSMQMRSVMCSVMLQSSSAVDGTVDNVRNIASVVANLLLDKGLVDTSAVHNCSSVLLQLVENSGSFAGDARVKNAVITAFNKLVGLKDLPSSIRSRIIKALGTLTRAIQESQAMGEKLQLQGQEGDTVILIGATVMNINNNVEGSTLDDSLPVSSFEAAAGVPKNRLSIVIPPGIVDDGSSVGVAMTTFPVNNIRSTGKNLVSGQTVISTSVKSVEGSATLNSKSRRRLQSATDEFVIETILQNVEDITYFKTVPLNGSIHCLRTGLNHTLTVLCPVHGLDVPEEYVFACPGTFGVTHNFTCPMYTLTPYCGVWNGSDYVRTDESGFYNSGKGVYQCLVSNYSRSSTTCTCRLASSSLSLAAVLQSEEPLEVVTMIDVVVTTFATFVTFEGTPDFVVVTQDVLAFVTTSAVFFIFFIGFIALFRFDTLQQMQKSGVKKYLEAKHETTGTHLLLRNLYFPLHRNDEAQLEAISSLSYYAMSGKISVPSANHGHQERGEETEKMKKESELLQSLNPSITAGLHSPSLPSDLRKEKQQHIQKQSGSIQWFINSALPVEYTGMPWEIRFQEKLYEFHDVSTLYLWLKYVRETFHESLYGKTTTGSAKVYSNSSAFMTNSPPPNDEKSKEREEEINLVQIESQFHSLRWIILGSRMVNIIFWASVFVSIYFSNNGQCESSRYEENCLKKKTLFGLKNQCTWDPALETACAFNLESIVDVQSLGLMVITVLFITMICTEPLWRLWMTAYQLWKRLERIPIHTSFAAMQSAYKRQFSNPENPDVIHGAIADESDNEAITTVLVANRKKPTKLPPGKPNKESNHGLPYNPYDLVIVRLRSMDNGSKSLLSIFSRESAPPKEALKSKNTTGKDMKKSGPTNAKKGGNNGNNVSLSRAVMTQAAKSKQAAQYQLDPTNAAQLTLMNITRYHILRQYHSRQRLHPLRKHLLLQKRMFLESSEEDWGRAAGYSSLDEGHAEDWEAEERERANQTAKLVRRIRRMKYLDRAIWFKAARLCLLQMRSDRLTARREALTLLVNHATNQIHDRRIFQLALNHFLAISPRYPLGTITAGAAWLYVRDVLYRYTKRLVDAVTHSASAPVLPSNGDLPLVTTGAGNNPTAVILPASYLVYAFYYIVRGIRIEAKHLQDHVSSLDRDVDRDTYLMQMFMAEQLSFLPRRFAQAHLLRRFHVMFDLPGYLTNSSWGVFLTLGLLVCSLLFMMAYVFVMSLRFGSEATPYWLVIILASVSFEWSVFQPLRLFIKWIWIPGVHLAPIMRLTHCLMKEKCKYWMQRSFGMIRTVRHASFVQHTSVACRLARLFPDLPASRILLSIHDNDIRLDKIRPVHHETYSYQCYESLQHLLLILLCFPWVYLTPTVLLESVLDVWVTAIMCALIALWLYIFVYISLFAGVAIGAAFVLSASYSVYFMLSIKTAHILLKDQYLEDDTDALDDLSGDLRAASYEDDVAGVKVKPLPATSSSSWWKFGHSKKVAPVGRGVLLTEAVEQERDEQDSSIASKGNSKVVPLAIESDMSEDQSLDSAVKTKKSPPGREYSLEDRNSQVLKEISGKRLESIDYEEYMKRARLIQMSVDWAAPKDALFAAESPQLQSVLDERTVGIIKSKDQDHLRKMNKKSHGLEKIRKRFRLQREELQSVVDMPEEEVERLLSHDKDLGKQFAAIHPLLVSPGSTSSAYDIFQQQKWEETLEEQRKQHQAKANRRRMLRIWQRGMTREEFVRRKDALYQRLIELAVNEHQRVKAEERRRLQELEDERLHQVLLAEERQAFLEEQDEAVKRLALLKALEMDDIDDDAHEEHKYLNYETKEEESNVNKLVERVGRIKIKPSSKKVTARSAGGQDDGRTFTNGKPPFASNGLARYVPRHQLREVLLQHRDEKRRRELTCDESFALDFTAPSEDSHLQGTALVMNPQDRQAIEAILQQKSALKKTILPEISKEILQSIREQTVTIQSQADVQKLKDEGATIISGRHKMRLPRHVLRLKQQLAKHAEELKEADAELTALKERHVPVGTQISRDDYVFEGLDDHMEDAEVSPMAGGHSPGASSVLDDIFAQVMAEENVPTDATGNDDASTSVPVAGSTTDKQQPPTTRTATTTTTTTTRTVQEKLSSAHVKGVLSQAAASSQDPVKALTQHLLSVQGLLGPGHRQSIPHDELSSRPLHPIDRHMSSPNIDQLHMSARIANRSSTTGAKNHNNHNHNHHTLRFLQRVQRQAKQIHQEHADTLLTAQDSALPIVKDAFSADSTKAPTVIVPPPSTNEIPAQRDAEAEINARMMHRRERKRLKNLQKIALNQRLASTVSSSSSLSSTFPVEATEADDHDNDYGGRERVGEQRRQRRQGDASEEGALFSPAAPSPQEVTGGKGLSTSGKHIPFRRTIEDDLRLEDNIDETDFFEDYAAIPGDVCSELENEGFY